VEYIPTHFISKSRNEANCNIICTSHADGVQKLNLKTACLNLENDLKLFSLTHFLSSHDLTSSDYFLFSLTKKIMKRK